MPSRGGNGKPKHRPSRVLHPGSTSCLFDEAWIHRDTPAADRLMQIQLRSILDQFDRAQARLHVFADHLPDARWAERADPARWSVAECVAHLNLTSRAYLPLLHEALEEVAQRDEPPPDRYRRDRVGWILSLLMGPVPRIGGLRIGAVKTIPAFVPEGDFPRAQLLADFDRLQKEQSELVRVADGRPIHLVWVTSPFDERLRYNLYSTFVILPKHQLRHVVQAERVWP
jgi:hypothetical protein